MAEEQELYRKFINELRGLINNEEKGNIVIQSKAFKELLKAERAFAIYLFRIKNGKQVYKDFIEFIHGEESNLLVGRSYFRESLVNYTKTVTPILRNKQYNKLYKCHLNFRFISFAHNRYTGPGKGKLNTIFNNIVKMRNHLCEANIPLALNKTNIFWQRAKYNKQEYMDLVQSAVEGLLHAIDKYEPSRAEFRHVAISRVLLNLMTGSNKTDLAVSQKDRKILYRINLGVKLGLKDKQLLAFVKKSFPKVRTCDIIDLLRANTGILHLEDPVGEKDGDTSLTLGSTLADEENVEENAISSELYNQLYKNLGKLTVLERKIVRLKFGL